AVKMTEKITASDRYAWRRRSRRRSASSRLIRAAEFSDDDMGLVHLSEQTNLRSAEAEPQHVLSRTGRSRGPRWVGGRGVVGEEVLAFHRGWIHTGHRSAPPREV